MFNWMIGIVHFVGCWIILSSCDCHWGLFWLWCKQVFWSFKFLIIRFVRQDWSNIQRRDNYSLLLQEHLNTLLMSYEWDFSAWLVGTGTVTGCVSAGYYCYEAGSLCTSYQLEFGGDGISFYAISYTKLIYYLRTGSNGSQKPSMHCWLPMAQGDFMEQMEFWLCVHHLHCNWGTLESCLP